MAQQRIKKLIDLVIDNSTLSRQDAYNNLFQYEDLIRKCEVIKDYSKSEKEYFILSAGIIINNYRRKWNLQKTLH